MQDRGADERLTLREAAQRLGISEGAVRKRISRRRLRSEMGEDGRRYVYVPTSDPEPEVEGSENTALVESLQDQVRYLRGQLAEEREARRRADHLLASLMERVPELEAPSEPREAPESAAEEPEGAAPRSSTAGAQEGSQRPSWWQRIFGG